MYYLSILLKLLCCEFVHIKHLADLLYYITTLKSCSGRNCIYFYCAVNTTIYLSPHLVSLHLRENVTKGPLRIGTHKMALLYTLSASIRREKKINTGTG